MNKSLISAGLILVLVGATTFIVRFVDGELNKPIITTEIQQLNENLTNTIKSENPTNSVEFAPALKEEDLAELSKGVSEWTKQEIKRYIEVKALEYGVPTSTALFIAEHESNFEPWRIGDTDKFCKDGPNKGEQMQSVGLWQINLCVHFDITFEGAKDVVSSTLWAMPHLKTEPEIWSAWRFCEKLYGIDCKNL